jgi:hypothetical protein
MFRAPALTLAIALLPSIAQAELPAGCAASAAIGDGWPVSEPEAQQLNPALICAIKEKLEKLKDANPHGVVIVRNGVVVYETYFAGPDQRWPQQHWEEPLENTPHDIGTMHDVQSLVLDNGSWHGRQIVSADWIKEMTSPRVVTSKFSYAYLWWRDQSSLAGRNVEWISGSGWGGQCLNIVPKLALVVVVTAGVYDFQGKGPQNLACDTVMDTIVLPAALDR